MARQLLSLDHLSGGRAAWNLVTSFARAAADNFSARGAIGHDERYRIAEEAIDLVKKLWDSWGDDTIVEDRLGIFNDVTRIARYTTRLVGGRAQPPLITPSLRFIVCSTEDEVQRIERSAYEI
jgi:alkanesulfonate monooxygenase SsuD/methylene tetrahydromethanopterin reductase-like flavin-dependent oxidoreductase (luciferase family)